MGNDEYDTEASIEELSEIYNGITGDWVTIKVSSVDTKGRGGDTITNAFVFKVRCKNNRDKTETSTTTTATANSGMFGMVMELMKSNHSSQMKHQEDLFDLKLKNLQRDFDDKEKNKAPDPVMLEGLNMIKSLIGNNQNTGLAGIEETAKPVQGANSEKIKRALRILAQIDPNIADNLLKLAALAKKDKGKYMMAVQYLSTM